MSRYEVIISNYEFDYGMVHIPESKEIIFQRISINGDTEFDKKTAIKLAKQISADDVDEHFTQYRNRSLVIKPNRIEVIDSETRRKILSIKKPLYISKQHHTSCNLNDWIHADENYKEVIKAKYKK